MRALSVKTRTAATSVSILAVSLGAVVLLIALSTADAARRDAEEVMSVTAASFASQTEADLNEAYSTARDLGATLAALRATGGSRAQADEIERVLLEQHEDYLGVWSGWEPDGFDGVDAEHVSDPTSDTSGRYITYWYRDGGAITSAPLLDYDVPGVGDYYQVPLTSGQDKVLDPYEYEVGGATVLMTSVTTPITDGDEVVGVSGVDIALSRLQETTAGITVDGTGSATLVSTSGAVVASADADAVGSLAPDDVLDLVRQAQEGLVSTTATTAAGEVLRVGAPVRLTDQDTWVLVVDVPLSAVLADAHRLRSTILLVGGVSLLLAAGVALLAARRLVRPIEALQRRMTEISEGDGDLTQRVDESRADEIGALGYAFNRFVDKVAGTVRQIGATSVELGASAAALQDVASQLRQGTSATSSGTAQLAQSGRQVDDSVQTVAAGIEEMGVTAGEIAGNAIRAAQMASTSVETAAATTETITSLGASSAEIGEVVKVITAIAAQTNLLALNATIEAARAGEAGKGFAVVASEVKDLAQETSRATQDIAARVQAIQQDAVRAGEALGRISGSITALDEEQTSIAAAVEEQAATVRSMATTINEAAHGTAGMSAGIDHVDQMAAQTSSAAQATSDAAEELDRTAQRLRDLVGDFRC